MPNAGNHSELHPPWQVQHVRTSDTARTFGPRMFDDRFQIVVRDFRKQLLDGGTNLIVVFLSAWILQPDAVLEQYLRGPALLALLDKILFLHELTFVESIVQIRHGLLHYLGIEVVSNAVHVMRQLARIGGNLVRRSGLCVLEISPVSGWR